jgi:hypothetical protein
MSNLMPLNVHTVDRIARVILGIALLTPLALVGFSIGPILSGVVGLVLLATAAVGSCPIYTALGLSTRGGASTPKAS